MASSAHGDPSLETRIVEAALTCIARWGIAKTTLDDVGREARCARATIYRTFSGGKREVMRSVVHHEVARLAAAVDTAMVDAATLDDLLVDGAVAAARFLRCNDALTFLLAHEPDAVLPHVAFDKLDRLLVAIADFCAPHLVRFLPVDEVAAASEWATRVVLSYALNPSERCDLTVESDARRLVTTFLVPALDQRTSMPRS
ncbi:MAG: TetR/AcrR family transcriptional regulator [Acidimicrobiales bacterium]